MPAYSQNGGPHTEMVLAERGITLGLGRGARIWVAVALLEAGSAALCGALIAFGSLMQAPSRPAWLAGAAALMLLYLGMSLWVVFCTTAGGSRTDSRTRALPWISTLPFLLLFLAQTILLRFRPGAGSWVQDHLSPIQPFPVVAILIFFLLVFLLKTLSIWLAFPTRDATRNRTLALSADVAAPLAMVLIGVLQASVYIIPIGNAFLRFWAIADAITSGTSYPVVLTEPGPVAAGSPPYVYDLPLFPMMLQASFALLGHNSAAAHLPAAISSALFPLSIYLLIREATGSRVTALVFGVLVSLFPYLRFWVLNLPDPDPFLETSLCFAAYFYLRALAAPKGASRWAIAGIASGVLSLSRPEGLLYAGFLGLGLLAHRPRVKQFGLFALPLGLLLAPMVATWMANFGFLWPQNYNRTLRLDYPQENYDILKGMDAIGFYQRGLGLDGTWAAGLLALFVVSVLLGAAIMVARDRRLLAIAVPGIGNSVAIWFANPYIPNTFHFADFFRHASFGIPLLVFTSAYCCYQVYGYLARRPPLKIVGLLCLFLLIAAVAREGDILANPTATHRPGATQVLTTYTYLSMQAIMEHPMPLPAMTYYRDGNMTIASLTSMSWPQDALDFFAPLDMSFDSNGRPFGYASVIAFLVALGFAFLASTNHVKEGPGG